MITFPGDYKVSDILLRRLGYTIQERLAPQTTTESSTDSSTMFHWPDSGGPGRPLCALGGRWVAGASGDISTPRRPATPSGSPRPHGTAPPCDTRAAIRGVSKRALGGALGDAGWPDLRWVGQSGRHAP